MATQFFLLRIWMIFMSFLLREETFWKMKINPKKLRKLDFDQDFTPLGTLLMIKWKWLLDKMKNNLRWLRVLMDKKKSQKKKLKNSWLMAHVQKIWMTNNIKKKNNQLQILILSWIKNLCFWSGITQIQRNSLLINLN